MQKLMYVKTDVNKNSYLIYCIYQTFYVSNKLAKYCFWIRLIALRHLFYKAKLVLKQTWLPTLVLCYIISLHNYHFTIYLEITFIYETLELRDH